MLYVSSLFTYLFDTFYHLIEFFYFLKHIFKDYLNIKYNFFAAYCLLFRQVKGVMYHFWKI